MTEWVEKAEQKIFHFVLFGACVWHGKFVRFDEQVKWSVQCVCVSAGILRMHASLVALLRNKATTVTTTTATTTTTNVTATISIYTAA